MEGNEILKTHLVEKGLTQAELADAVNDRLLDVGYHGTVSDRTVRNWITGKTRWPHPRQRSALEAVFGYTAVELGFTPPADTTEPTTPPEQPVRRRDFLTATTGTAAAASLAAAAGPKPRVGSTDVERLTAKLANLVASDDRHGGTAVVESRAVQLARGTLQLQQNSFASQRIRSRLYSLAAAFTSSAMWAATDGRRLDEAQQHLNEAVTLAGLSGDPAVKFRVWGHAGALYRQLERPTDALAADDAARAVSVTRRDPLYASVAHARTAVHQADRGDKAASLRSLGHAQDALDRADLTAPRPPWMAFYDQAELELLGLIANNTLGRWAEAEAHAHRHLALLRPHLVRNRALAHAHLAHAQLGQGALSPAVTSALTVPARARLGRIDRILKGFSAQIAALAPGTPET